MNVNQTHLDSFPVEPDIPVCQLVNKANQLWHNSVQAISWGYEILKQNKTKHLSTDDVTKQHSVIAIIFLQS